MPTELGLRGWKFWRKKKETPEQRPSTPEDVGGIRNLHERLAQIPVGYGFLLPTREGYKEFKCIGVKPYPKKEER